MKINPLISPIKISNSDLKLSGKSVNLGDFLKGQVVQSEGNSLTLSMDGKLVTVLNTMNQNLPLGETITLEIKGFEGDVPLAQVVNETNEPVSQDLQVSSLLLTLNLPDNEENQNLVKSMLDFNIPMSEENVKAIKSNFTSLKMLVQSQPGEGDHVPIKTEVPIKEAVVAFLKGEIPESVKESPVNQEIPSSDNNSTTGDKVTVPFESANNEVVNQETGKQEPILDTKTDGLDQMDKAESSSIKNDEVKENVTSKETVLETLKDVVDRSDVEKFTLLMKSKLPMNLKNLMMSEQVVFGKKTVTESVARLSELLTSLKEEGVLESLPKGLSEKIEEPLQLLKIVEESLNDKDLPKELQPLKENFVQEAQFIRDAVEFVEDLNQEVGFMQLPMEMNGEIVNMDLYTQSGGKNKGNENFSIFISLDTKNLEKVQVSIKKYPETVALNFLLADEKIKNTFAAGESVLRGVLEGLDIGKFSLKFIERNADKTFSDFLKDENVTGVFDMKV